MSHTSKNSRPLIGQLHVTTCATNALSIALAVRSIPAVRRGKLASGPAALPPQ